MGHLQRADDRDDSARGAARLPGAAARLRGVELVQFDFLTPEAVAAYCAERGFLQVRTHRAKLCWSCNVSCACSLCPCWADASHAMAIMHAAVACPSVNIPGMLGPAALGVCTCWACCGLVNIQCVSRACIGAVGVRRHAGGAGLSRRASYTKALAFIAPKLVCGVPFLDAWDGDLPINSLCCTYCPR